MNEAPPPRPTSLRGVSRDAVTVERRSNLLNATTTRTLAALPPAGLRCSEGGPARVDRGVPWRTVLAYGFVVHVRCADGTPLYDIGRGRAAGAFP